MVDDLVGDAEFLGSLDADDGADSVEHGLAWAVLATRLELLGLGAQEAEGFAAELESIAREAMRPVKRFALERALVARLSGPALRARH